MSKRNKRGVPLPKITEEPARVTCRPKNDSMDVTDADGEWSEESAEFNSDCESAAQVANSKKDKEVKQRTSTKELVKPSPAVPLSSAAVKPLNVLNLKSVDDLMDKIDAEIDSFSIAPVPVTAVTKKPPKYQPLKVQVTAQSEQTTDSLLLSKEQSEKSKDTGLGSASVPEDSKSSDMDRNNRLFSDSESDLSDLNDVPSIEPSEELDSDAAQTVNKNYKEIMKKKRGGYLRNLKTQCLDSDLESVRTEDFEVTFCLEMANLPVQGALHKKLLKKNMAHYGSDTDTVRTEDFADKFQEISVPPEGKRGGFLSNGNSSSRRSKSKNIPSDLESTKTEDFETTFKTIMVKHVAGVPVTAFDQKNVESDIDTVQSCLVHEKFKEAMASSPYRTVYADSDESLSGLDSEPEAAANGYSGESEGESIEAAAGSPTPEFTNRGRAYRHNGQNGHEPVNGHHNNEDIDLSVEAQQIEEESASIQRQMEKERRMKYGTPKEKLATEVISENTEKSETVSLADTQSVDEDDITVESQQIEQESGHIQKEIELERKGKLTCFSTPGSLAVDSKFASSTPNLSLIGKFQNGDSELGRKRLEYNELNENIRKAKQEKRALMRDLTTLQDSITRTQSDIKQTEKQAKENRSKAEQARSELMLVDFKKQTATQEVEKVNSELMRKKKRLKDLDGKMKAQQNELKEYKPLGLTKEQVLELLEERTQLQEKVRNWEGVQRERDELESQLVTAKQDLFNEQRKSRAKIEEMEEELDTGQHKLEEAQLDRETALEKVQQFEHKVKKLEREKIELSKEKLVEYEDMREKLQNDMLELRINMNNEVGVVKDQLQQQTDRVVQLEADVNHKDELNLQLRNQLIEVQQELTKEMEEKDNLMSEHQTNIQNLRREMECMLGQQKEAAAVEKEHAMTAMRCSMEEDRALALSNMEESMNQQLGDYQHALQDKEEELNDANERLREQREECERLVDSVREQGRNDVRTTLAKERENWEREKDDIVKSELSRFQSESVKAVARMSEQLEKEKALNERLQAQLSALLKELEEQRQQNRQAYEDKMAALTKTKEQVKEEKENELDELRVRLGQEKEGELEELRVRLHEREDEIQQLKAERLQSSLKERDEHVQFDRLEKMVVSEINEECRRSALVLGVTPRKVNIASFRSDSPSNNKSPVKGQLRSPSRTPATSSLANLRACNEELRNNVKELTQEVEAQKQALIRMEQTKERSLNDMKQKSLNEKNRDLSELRERLVKEHLEELNLLQRTLAKDKTLQERVKTQDNELREIQRNMKKWKEETAEKFARKFEEELTRELEKRLKDQHKRRTFSDRDFPLHRRDLKDKHSTSMNGHGEANDSAVQMLRHLQDKVKQLRSENASLRKSHSVSTPDLSSLSEASLADKSRQYDVTYVKSLEKRVRRAEKQAEEAEERAQKNQEILSNKMVEMTNLQKTLTAQTKEIMSLEQTNSQLKMRLSRASPSRLSSGSSR